MSVAQEVPLPRPSFDELIRLARAGDERALEELFLQSRQLLTAWASKKQNRGQPGGIRPSDLAQETALRAFKGFARFRGTSGAQWHAWLEKVFLNQVAQAFRDAKRQKRGAAELVSLDGTDLEEVRAPGRSPSQIASLGEEWRHLLVNLAQLPHAQKEAIRRVHLKELPVAKVAAEMNRTSASVTMLIQRGLATLRSWMAGESGAPAGEEAGLKESAGALLEFLERRDRGEDLDLETFIAQHPTCADDLRVMFHWIERLRALPPPPPT